MYKNYILISLLSVSFVLGQYNYNLENINSTSDTYGTNLSPESYTGQVTLHYFGHQN